MKDSTIESIKIMLMVPVGFLLVTFVIAPLCALAIIAPFVILIVAFNINILLGLLVLGLLVTWFFVAASSGRLR